MAGWALPAAIVTVLTVGCGTRAAVRSSTTSIPAPVDTTAPTVPIVITVATAPPTVTTTSVTSISTSTTVPPRSTTSIITIPEDQTADAQLACSTWRQQLRTPVEQAIAGRNPSPLIAMVFGNSDPNSPWATGDGAATAAGPLNPGESLLYKPLADAFESFATAVGRAGPGDVASIQRAASAIDSECRAI